MWRDCSSRYASVHQHHTQRLNSAPATHVVGATIQAVKRTFKSGASVSFFAYHIYPMTLATSKSLHNLISITPAIQAHLRVQPLPFSHRMSGCVYCCPHCPERHWQEKDREGEVASERLARDTRQEKVDIAMKGVVTVQDRLIQALRTELEMTDRARRAAQVIPPLPDALPSVCCSKKVRLNAVVCHADLPHVQRGSIIP